MKHLTAIAALLLAVAATACTDKTAKGDADPAVTNQLRGPGPAPIQPPLPSKGSVPDDSIKPVARGGTADDGVKPIAPARVGTADDGVKPTAPVRPTPPPPPPKR